MTMHDVEALKREKILAKEFQDELLEKFGPLITGGRLVQFLGYPSMGAFRQALCRGQVPVDIFTLKNRSGKFALTKDIANWLAEQKVQAEFEGGNSIRERK